ncbi:MAG TPA: TetR/AcrR family transcriptional regulator [Candidatus Limnocylindrales bacterium]|jgi:AcrR family transcriptional regulator
MGAENQDVPYRNSSDTEPVPRRGGGRPRSDAANRAILYAAREELVEHGFTKFRIEHVAARAGVGKSTLYRRWASKEALAQDLLADLAAPHISVDDVGDTSEELYQCVEHALHALRDTPFGAVIRALVSQIAINPKLGDPFRATVVHARRTEIARVVARGIERGDLRPDCAADVATELLVGPVYFRLIFGGDLGDDFARTVSDTVYLAFSTPRA